MKVQKQRPGANGATWSTGQASGCYAEFNMQTVNSGVTAYVTCQFEGCALFPCFYCCWGFFGWFADELMNI